MDFLGGGATIALSSQEPPVQSLHAVHQGFHHLHCHHQHHQCQCHHSKWLQLVSLNLHSQQVQVNIVVTLSGYRYWQWLKSLGDEWRLLNNCMNYDWSDCWFTVIMVGYINLELSWYHDIDILYHCNGLWQKFLHPTLDIVCEYLIFLMTVKLPVNCLL